LEPVDLGHSLKSVVQKSIFALFPSLTTIVFVTALILKVSQEYCAHLKETCIGIEAGWKENRILCAMELADCSL
jgi:hypothetical protein